VALKVLNRSEEVGCGPFNFHIAQARRSGWSEESIAAAWEVVSAVARAEYGRAHFGYPVAGCPCVACDLSTDTHDLPEEYSDVRRSWNYVGGDDGYQRRPPKAL
jgi:hypothetical protein